MKKYKNKIWIAVLALLILIVGFSVFAGAASEACNVVIDDIKIAFDNDSGTPFIDKNNRTLVPLRKTMEAYGCEVGWDHKTYTASVKMEGTTVLVGIGDKYISVNGKKVEIDTEAKIVDNRTYLPIRAVLEAFGAKVDWENSTRTVDIKSPEYLAGQPRLSSPVSEVNLDQYGYAQVPINVTSPVEISGGLTYTFGDGTVARGAFNDDVEYGAELVINAFEPGSTTVRISFENPQYTDSITVKINVSEPERELTTYNEFPNVPNIGEYCGLKLANVKEDDVVIMYEYDISTYDKEKYGPNVTLFSRKILGLAGFEQYDTLETITDLKIGEYYRNINTGDKVLLAASKLPNGDIGLAFAVFK